MDIKKYRKLFIPAFFIGLIVNTNPSHSFFNSNKNVELWGGIKSGMNNKQVLKTLGGDASCTEPINFETIEKPFFVCYRENPSVKLLGEKAFVSVSFLGNSVEKVSLIVNYRERECGNYSSKPKDTCLITLEYKDQNNIRNLSKTLEAKYGQKVPLTPNPTLRVIENSEGWLNDGKQMQIIYFEEGSYGLSYSKEENPL